MPFLGHILRELSLFPAILIQECTVSRETVVSFVIPRIQSVRHIKIVLELISCTPKDPERALFVGSQETWDQKFLSVRLIGEIQRVVGNAYAPIDR